MGTYDAIVRVRKWELDQQRRELRAKQDVLQTIDDALQEIADNVANAEEGVDPAVSALTLGAFLEGARVRQKDLLKQRVGQQEEVERHQLLVQNAFQDLKTIEIAAEQEARREAVELARREQGEIDEIALRLRMGDPIEPESG